MRQVKKEAQKYQDSKKKKNTKKESKNELSESEPTDESQIDSQEELEEYMNEMEIDYGAIEHKKIENKSPEQIQKEQKAKSNDFFCITMVILLFLSFQVFMKLNEEKFAKFEKYDIKNKEGFVDFYEILGTDQYASQSEIKEAYRKQAKIWHPDKNPQCGKECDLKFQQIKDAFENIGNPEKRQQYDENTGIITKIKSIAQTLTEQNFDRLVTDSNDVWIIQVYEDGNDRCEHVADTWDKTVKEFQDSVKFGRINKDNSMRLLKRLPVNIVLIPSVISMFKGQCEIHNFNRNFGVGLKNFIQTSVQNKIEFIENDRFKEFKSDLTPYKKLSLYMLRMQAQESVYLKSLALKYENEIEILMNVPKQYMKQKDGQKFNAIVQYNNQDNSERLQQTFYFETDELKKSHLQRLITFMKFHTIPSLNKYNFAEFCRTPQQQTNIHINEEDQLSSSDLQTLCIVLIKQKSQSINQKMESEAKKFIFKYNQEMIKNVIQGQNYFQEYTAIQFAWLDLDENVRFKNTLNDIAQEAKFNGDQLAFGVLVENNKIQFMKNIDQMEDWIEDQVDGPFQPQFQFYSQKEDLSKFLEKDNFNLPYEIVFSSFSNMFDILTLVSIICLVFGYIIYQAPKSSAYVWVIAFFLHSSMSVLLAVHEFKDNIWA